MNQLIDVRRWLHLARTLLRCPSRAHGLCGQRDVDIVDEPFSTAVAQTVFSARDAMAAGHIPASSAGQVHMSTWQPANLQRRLINGMHSLSPDRRQFWPKRCFLVSYSPNRSCVPNLKLLASTVAEISRGSQNFGGCSPSPDARQFWYYMLLTKANLCTKFEVASFNGCRNK